MMKGSLILHKRRVCSLYAATMSPIYNPLCLPANIALPIHHALDIQFFFLHIFLFTVVNGTKFYKQKIGLVWWSGPIEACNISRRGTYLIFVIFSPHTQSLVSFFSTQKCVNRIKTDFETNSVNHDKTILSKKQHNMYTFKDILHIIHNVLHMPIVEKLQISPHLSCGEI